MSFNLTFTENGVVAPEMAEIKSDFQALFQEIFGVQVTLDDASMIGQLITALSKIVYDKNNQLIFVINQFNPENSSGIWQDALAKLYFLNRKAATSSTVICECGGAQGTVLGGKSSANPAKAKNANGDIFVCVDGGVIPASGTISLAFEAEETGEIAVPANSVNSIYTQVIGWDTVNNSSSGVVGTLQESQFSFEERRKKSLALNAVGNLESVYAAVFEVDGVTDCFAKENDEDTPLTVGGVTIGAHSIYVCVNGGDSTEIAKAIKLKKSGGCSTTGNIEVYVNNALVPIRFDRAADVDVYVNVVVVDPITPSVEAQIKKIIIDNFNGSDGFGKRVTIADTVYASRFYAPLTEAGINISNILVGLSSPASSLSASCDYDEILVLSEGNITVTGA